MTTRWREQQISGVTELTTRYVAWLRLPLLVPVLLAALEPMESLKTPWFHGTLVAYAAWAVARLVAVHRYPRAGAHGAVCAAAIDVVAVGVLSALSGGPDSAVRYAYFVLPMASVLWQLPVVTAWLGAACMVAYAAMALPHLLSDAAPAVWPVVIDEAYLLWDVGAGVLIAALLERRSSRVVELLDTREALLRNALDAESRERAVLADALHDSAVQNLLAALHELEEAADDAPSSALARAEGEVRATVRELREVIFDLHPQVLASVGLAAALESAGEHAARRGGFTVHDDLRLDGRVRGQTLLYSAARELLANVVKHAGASNVWVTLARDGDDTVLTVRDDGEGFDTDVVRQRMEAGHIGLASHYVRIESAGGRFTVDSAPGRSTTVEVRLPYGAEDTNAVP
ncbi:histidine kinase [Streptomyces klenkii]|uniref:Histidine kinase n=1 Tax=Streptomyces klenkii TaxID=1420899 RepID=A0A3B0BZW3_9ACTN|nr:ATP-binding protein [Streptomyces klenkii]RKN77664.1 histidine kinase [Streptomyces klenkii]